MKKLVLSAVLTMVSMQGNLFAQENKPAKISKTESNFSMHPKTVNMRHIAYLTKDEKMIIEMQYHTGYALLGNIDSLLAIVMGDIDFYKDSLDNTSSVRIDYTFTSIPGMRKIRFQKYAPEGEMYIGKRNELARLKIEQDTIRILFENSTKEKTLYDADDGRSVLIADVPLQVTFCLNNYSDLGKLLTDKQMLPHIIDTLNESSRAKKAKKDSMLRYSTILYKTYEPHTKPYSRYVHVNYVSDDENGLLHATGTLVINGNLGAALVKNTLAPMAELGIEVNDRFRINPTGFSFVRLSTTPYCFFDKGTTGNTIVNDNWFVNLELGVEGKKSRTSMGVGYLYSEKGGYFQNTTMKLYASRSISKHMTLSPEVIITNDFKQVYPGVTLKFLGH